MKILGRLILACVLLTYPAAGRTAESAAGFWKGAITLPTTSLRIQVALEETTEGFDGTIDIPVQGLRGFKLAEVQVEESAVAFKMPNIPGNPVFEGTIENSDTIKGTFKQSGQEFPFTLERTDGGSEQGETPIRGVPGDGLVGAWQGSLMANAFELRIVFKIEESSEGLTGTMDSLDQNALNIPLTAVSFEGKSVEFSVRSVGGTYQGQLNEDGSEIDGNWKQGGMPLTLTLKRLEKAPSTSRPQDPKPPYPYSEEELMFSNDLADIRLAGTLTLPPRGGPFPAAILISGSGPQDRNESLMGHRPFLVLADHLTRNGIAVLRYDDRGVGQSEGRFGTALVSDFTSDALAAVAFLKTHDRIDPNRIGLIGHSEGGLVAPRAATQSEDVAYIVMLAGVGVPLEDLLKRQGADLLRVIGADPETIAKQQATQQSIFHIALSDTKRGPAREQILKILETAIEELTPEQREAVGFEASRLEAQASMVLSPWFRDLLAIDPRPTLNRVKCPVLALNGEKDVQVAFEENLKGIETALKEGGNSDVTTQSFPNLNHLFQTCETGALAEYPLIEETFNEAVLRTISAWILTKVGAPKD